MHYILKTLTRLSWFLFPLASLAQSTPLQRGSKHEYFLERLEILMQDNNELNLATFKPISRKTAVMAAERSDSMHHFFPYDYYYHLSSIDQYSLRSLLLNNREWVQSSRDSFQSRKPLWNTFYKDKANFFAAEEKDFFLAVNPVIQEQQSIESAAGERVFLNAKGVTIRGLISKKLGFDIYVTDNQERGPEFFRERIVRY